MELRKELSIIYTGGKRIVVYNNGDVEEENLGEEPNERWYINEENEPQRVGFGDPVEDIENLEELGLLFNTKEGAEKAVEKLKAWKRLKDNGFRFIELRAPNYNAKTDVITIKAECNWNSNNIDDLNLFFGEEEE